MEKNKYVNLLLTDDEITSPIRVAVGRVAVAGVPAVAYGAFLLPITHSRSISLQGDNSTSSGGTISLWMHAYKKIG